MKTPSLQKLVEDCLLGFVNEFGQRPSIGASAPGRVNIIGEHTDYNEGFVLPMAIPAWTVIVGRKNETNAIRLFTLAPEADEPKKIEFTVPSENLRLDPGNPKWANYAKGVIEHFPGAIPGFDAVIITSVPIGGGLSSSAALEVATCTFLETLIGQKLKPKEKVLLCQKAEHTFAGMPCGIMDQMISVMAEVNSALLIDCRSLESTAVPLAKSEETKEFVFLIVNSNVKHQLVGSEYSQRREDCYKAAEILGVKSLREASLAALRENRDKMGDRIYRRALHVVSEIERCEKASEAMGAGDLERLGRLMYQSHVSLRDLYEVSCAELDALVDITMQQKGVLGSRMTGGGFGGCIVALIKKSEAENIIGEINRQYTKKASSYIFEAAAGAAEIKFD